MLGYTPVGPTAFEPCTIKKKATILPTIQADDLLRFNADGHCLISSALSTETVQSICALLTTLESSEWEHQQANAVYAGRDVFARSPELLHITSQSPLMNIARSLVGPKARPTKATVFDKRPEANWTLPLHQDLTITVKAQADVRGYTHWSVKAGVPHVQPPVPVLERIVALRVHLDDCPAENGALEVVPGSHRLGRIPAKDLQAMHASGKMIPCPAAAGDVLAMRPLLVHGSGKAKYPHRRRVLHIEYSASDLDAPLEWPDWSSGD